MSCEHCCRRGYGAMGRELDVGEYAFSYLSHSPDAVRPVVLCVSFSAYPVEGEVCVPVTHCPWCGASLADDRVGVLEVVE